MCSVEEHDTCLQDDRKQLLSLAADPWAHSHFSRVPHSVHDGLKDLTDTDKVRSNRLPKSIVNGTEDPCIKIFAQIDCSKHQNRHHDIMECVRLGLRIGRLWRISLTDASQS